MIKHTPGPWKAVSSVNFESGLTYVSVQPEHSDAERDKPLAMANGEFHVCRMSHTAAWHRIALHEANAGLIAASPELLEVVKAFIAEITDYAIINKLGDPEKQHNIKWARQVIAKAEGGEA